MTEIDLSAFRGSVIIGSNGGIKLDGVCPKHAAIAQDNDGEADDILQVLKPLEGSVAVERRGKRFHVGDRWVLADGDVVVIGEWHLMYRDLASKGPSTRRATKQEKGGVSWHRS